MTNGGRSFVFVMGECGYGAVFFLGGGGGVEGV